MEQTGSRNGGLPSLVTQLFILSSTRVKSKTFVPETRLFSPVGWISWGIISNLVTAGGQALGILAMAEPR